VTVSRDRAHGGHHLGDEAVEERGFWPFSDGAASGLIGGAFGAYIGAVAMLFPRIQPLHYIGTGNLVFGSAIMGAVLGIVLSLAIKACFPHHEQDLEASFGKPALVTVTIHGDDGREAQLINEVLVATGHSDSVHAPEGRTT
jgi:hypothetical protein